MRRIVLGTAGHIDHGKTSVVRMLTGVDTDRLAEEKARGITIELGFTHLQLPDGAEVGFVDVPGHERFVRTMIAGAAGIDLALLVIAADEGVMPQTKEHLDICSLLGVRDGLVVLNKIDAIDADMAELAREEAAQAMAGTFLEGRAIVPVSARTGAGRDALLAAIVEAADRVSDRATRGPFRMAVDRVFSMKGFGTVVTGTAAGGRVRVGDVLEVHPGGATGRVRGVQVHGKDANEALAGSRTALNLQGLDRDQVPRGSVLSGPGTLVPAHVIDVEYRHLADAPESFRPRRVRFLSGTQEVVGTLQVLDAPAATPGSVHLAQLRLEEPVAVRAGDRFVLRTYSPMSTVGGGRVLDNRARKHRASDPAGLEAARALLACLAGDDADARVRALVENAGPLGLGLAELAARLPPEESDEAAARVRALAKAGDLEALDGAVPRAVTRTEYERLAQALLARVTAFHREEPSKPGIPRGVLVPEAARAARVGGPDAPGVLEAVLRRLEAGRKVATVGGDVKLPSHTPRLDAASSDLRPVVEEAYRGAALTPPTVKELGEKHAGRAKELALVVGLLHREGVLVKVSQDLFFHRESLDALQERLVGYLREKSKITPLEFKDLAGVSRKFMIPLLEHFDTARVTMRIGDERVLRKKDA